MHAPTVHSLFELPYSPGLSELLCGEVELNKAVRSVPVPGLSVLPAGKWSMITRQRLVGDRWGKIKREMEAQFDFVIIDTAPMLLVTDTILMAREADGVIVSVLMGVSQIARVEETLNKLFAVGAEVVGIVVNKVPGAAYYQKYAYRKYPASGAAAAPIHLGSPVPGSGESKTLVTPAVLSDVSPGADSVRYADELTEES
jgi:Mrp family chromosome partitioning ATPase